MPCTCCLGRAFKVCEDPKPPLQSMKRATRQSEKEQGGYMSHRLWIMGGIILWCDPFVFHGDPFVLERTSKQSLWQLLRWEFGMWRKTSPQYVERVIAFFKRSNKDSTILSWIYTMSRIRCKWYAIAGKDMLLVSLKRWFPLRFTTLEFTTTNPQ